MLTIMKSINNREIVVVLGFIGLSTSLINNNNRGIIKNNKKVGRGCKNSRLYSTSEKKPRGAIKGSKRGNWEQFLHFFKRIEKGINVGWDAPTLPSNLTNLMKNKKIKVIQLSCGFITLIVISTARKLIYLPNILFYIMLIITLIYIMSIITLAGYKIYYIHKTISKVEVKNSAKDALASLIGKAVMYSKVLGMGVSVIGASYGAAMAIDECLYRSDVDPFILNNIGKMTREIAPVTELSHSRSINRIRDWSIENEKTKNFMESLRIRGYTDNDIRIKACLKEIESNKTKVERELERLVYIEKVLDSKRKT